MKDLKYVAYIGESPEKVWQCLISEEGTRASFVNCVLRTTLEIGAPYAYVGPGNDGEETVHVYGHVLTCVPNHELSLTEHAGPSYRDNHAELETRITYRLEAVGKCTKLTIINDQWPDHHPSYAQSQESWPMILSSIKTFAETGRTLDYGW